MSRRRFLAGSAALGLTPLFSRLPAFGAGSAGPRLQLVRVAVSSADQARLLDGFDVLCGQSSRRGVDVLLWPGDADRLRLLGLDYEVLDGDVGGGDAHYDGYAGYRHLGDYEADMRSLAARFPDRVRLFTLPERTIEGRSVYAVEIASDVNQSDGRPCFYIDGIHHAREWPSGELTMDFAIELAEGYDTNPRIHAVLDAVRVVAVPVVNPDGFDHSRRSAVQMLGETSMGGYWRKNRHSLTEDVVLPPQVRKPANEDAYGVDPNRNYAFHWGGAGSGSLPAEQTYRGHEPFSEPESRNVRSVLASRPVTALITNHTYSNLIIRPWGDTYADSPDEEVLRTLGARMAATNGYRNIKGPDLYYTTGTTDCYAYSAFGTIAYTVEHGTMFHPLYEDVAPLYENTREAFLIAVEAAADPSLHGVVTGRTLGSNGMRLRATIDVTKEFVARGASETWNRSERLDIQTKAADGGRFELHLNPSTRPLASSPEAYTVVFSALGYAPATRQVVVRRGERVDLGDVVLEARPLWD